MEIKLTNKEAEEMFHAALCNGAGYLSGYGFSLDYSNEKYREAKESLNSRIEEGSFKAKYGLCREDIWVEILRVGGTLTLIDGDNGGGHYNSTISLKDVHERVEKSPLNHLMDMINERDDAITADVILQTVFFNDVIFG